MAGKRKRPLDDKLAYSSSPCTNRPPSSRASPFPVDCSALTELNLCLHTALTTYNIYVDRESALDAEMSTFLDTMKATRDGAMAPTSRRTKDPPWLTRALDEIRAQGMLDNILVYRETYEDMASDAEREQEIMRFRNRVWWEHLSIPSTGLEQQIHAIFDKIGLSRVPQPRFTYGFTQATFNKKLHPILEMLPDSINPLNGEPFFPYWMIEQSHKHDGIEKIAPQARREGAAAVHATYTLFRMCGIHNPSSIVTAAFTTCVDERQLITRIHWRRIDPVSQKVFYEAAVVACGKNRKIEDMYGFRALVSNIKDWARKTRLPAIKHALESAGPQILSSVGCCPSGRGRRGSLGQGPGRLPASKRHCMAF
ncbi:MAG: hypothetical protein Q9219_006469 [cf. Caloplaca sp. 3 TL-2023]